MKFTISKSKNGEYYFTLRARNGQVIAQSETYHNRKDCIKTIKSIRCKAFFATIKDTTV